MSSPYIDSPDQAPEWPKVPTSETERVKKIVIGQPPIGDEKKPLRMATLPPNFAKLFPTLTHLYLWQIEGLRALPTLPPGLECLDVRGCGELEGLPELPNQLETLVVDGCSRLRTIPISAQRFPKLTEASMKGCAALEDSVVNSVLGAAPILKWFDAADCPQLEGDFHWLGTLERIELSGCAGIRRLDEWPPKLRRVGLRHATSLTRVPDLPRSADYVDLAYTTGLLKLPVFGGKPRTLFLFGSGAAVNPALYGETDTENVAAAVWADRGEAVLGRVSDNDVKVILLGNGRCGKSSLARRWVKNEFRTNEPSTHGIRLWKKKVDFDPIDDEGGTEEAAQLYIWDFAGQDLYHNTHRLFLQSRAVFILCYTEPGVGPGHDEASDKVEREKAEDDQDVERDLPYWRSQVKSLGLVPGLGIQPPVLVVRTKSDRSPTAPSIPDVVSFSAETAEGMDKLKAWVADAVATVLSRAEARSVPVRVMAVKQELAALMERNDEVHKVSEETRKPVRSPHPDMPYEEFWGLVQKHLPRSDYAEDPRLLLERFHRNGFVFYRKPHLPDLPDRVILDQRWAIDAIYTVSNRESEWNIREKLWRRNGQFTLSMLAQTAWTPAGYTPDEQRMVLGFMLACGMCFELLRADEAAAGEPVYAAPGFFPSREDMLRRLPELVAGPTGACAHYALPKVTEAEMMSVLSNLGAAWSRAATLWRWGATVAASDSGCRVLLDWQRPVPDDYTGTLSMWFSGRIDRGFEKEALERLQGICGDPLTREEISKHLHSLPQERELESVESRMPEGRESRRKEPERKEGVGIRVTFSFAGSDKNFPRNGDVPSRLGQKLKEQFKREGDGKVFCYDQPEGEERLSVFTESLAKGDLTLVFWSEKYWRSPYCCTEMMLIFNAPPEGRLLDHRVAIWVIDGGRISGSGRIRSVDFEKYWVEIATKRAATAAADANGDLRRQTKFLRRDGALHSWYELVLYEPEFEPFVKALREYRLGRPLALPSSEAETDRLAEELVAEVNAIVSEPVALMDLAVQRLENGRKEDAVWLLLQALGKNSDGQSDAAEILRNPGKSRIPAELLSAARELLNLGDDSQ